jgi:hypothetical protein
MKKLKEKELTAFIEPLGFKAKEKNEIFQTNYAASINKFVREFTLEYCDADGKIQWEKIIKLNSSREMDEAPL